MLFRVYPVLRYLILLIAGIISYDYLNIPVYWFVLGLVFTLLAGFLAIYYRSSYRLRHLIPVSFFFLGLILTYSHDQRRAADHISKFSHPEATIVQVDSYTETKAKTYKAIAKVISVYENDNWQSASGKILVYFNHEAGVFPEFGEIYMLADGMREIEEPKNPFEFDYKTFQARKNIFHHQFLKDGDFEKIGQDSTFSIFLLANKANNYTHNVFSQILDNNNQLGVAEAIIGGMRSELTGEVRNWYTKTGTVHALAVSGLHVGIIFLVLNWVFKRFLNPKRLPYIITIILLLWTYAVFTGLSPSVCRATLMFSIFQVGIFIKRNGDYVNVLLFSALVLLMIVPWWIYDVGFQLSHLAVLGILVLYPRINKLISVKNKYLKWLWDITTVSIAAQVYTLPLTLYYFQQFPNYFLLANPLVSLLCFIILPAGFAVLIFSWVPGLSYILGILFKYSIQLMISWVYFIFQLPFSVSEGISFFLLDVIFLFSVIGLFQIYLRSENIRYLKVSLLAFGVFFLLGSSRKFIQKDNKEITFHFIPRGYGISYIEGRNTTFFSTDSLVNEPLIYQYHLKNYYNSAGIKNFNKKAIIEDENQLISVDGFSVYWIKNKKDNQPVEADFTLISNNALDLSVELQNTLLILDGSNHRRYVEDAKTRYDEVVVLYDSGSKTVKL